MAEPPLPDGEHLADVVREAAASGTVVYLTDRGERLAAIVPAHLAELLERASPPGTSGTRSARGRPQRTP